MSSAMAVATPSLIILATVYEFMEQSDANSGYGNSGLVLRNCTYHAHHTLRLIVFPAQDNPISYCLREATYSLCSLHLQHIMRCVT
jgi:hypothetical protein